jgi:phospholipase/carboxylesterase
VTIDARTRPAAGEPEGALVLLHGRGADELDLVPLLDLLDPQRKLLGVTPRGPFSFPPGGAHWYALREVGYPDPPTFHDTYGRLTEWLDGLGFPPERIAVGGFSQGSVMSYALALGQGRPLPAAVIALSGFVPTVPGFDLDLESRAALPVAIGHGAFDREYPLPHAVDPHFLQELAPWLEEAMARARSRTRGPGGSEATPRLSP